jgi:hypothetical protein
MKRVFTLLTMTVLVAACGSTPSEPDAEGLRVKQMGRGYTIDVVRQPDGSLKAVPPECKRWRDQGLGRLDNEPLPQLGCATKGNLAKQIVDPADLVRDTLPPRAEMPSHADPLAAGVQRYNEGKVFAPDAQATE